MKSLLTFFCFLGVVSIQTGLAGKLSCREVLPSSQDWMVWEHIPIAEQRPLYTCYAYSASQLLEFELKKREQDGDSGFHVSPGWMAFAHKMLRQVHWSPDHLDYSLASWALQDIEKAGVCDPRIYGPELRSFFVASIDREEDVFFLAFEFYSFLDKKTYWQTPRPTQEREFAQSFVAWIQSDVNRFQGFIQPEDAGLFALKMRPYLALAGAFDFLSRVVFRSCQGHVQRISLPSWDTFGSGFIGDEALFREVQGRLQRNHKPIGVGYCYRALQAGSTIGVVPRFLKPALYPNDCDGHYSIVLGMKEIGGDCHLLLRNSIGTRGWAPKGSSCLCRVRSADGQMQLQSCLSAGDDPWVAADTQSESLETVACFIPARQLVSNSFEWVGFR